MQRGSLSTRWCLSIALSIMMTMPLLYQAPARWVAKLAETLDGALRTAL